MFSCKRSLPGHSSSMGLLRPPSPIDTPISQCHCCSGYGGEGETEVESLRTATVDSARGARGQRRWILHTERLGRPWVSLLAALVSFLGSHLSGPHVPLFSARPVIAALVVGLVCSFGFMINDYHDATVDRISKPHRPIPTGVVSRRAALGLAFFLATVAFFLACLLGFWSRRLATSTRSRTT